MRTSQSLEDGMHKREDLNRPEQLQPHSTGSPVHTRRALSESKASAKSPTVFPSPLWQLAAEAVRTCSPEGLDSDCKPTMPDFVLSHHTEEENLESDTEIKYSVSLKDFTIGHSEKTVNQTLVTTFLKIHACFMGHGVCYGLYKNLFIITLGRWIYSPYPFIKKKKKQWKAMTTAYKQGLPRWF